MKKSTIEKSIFFTVFWLPILNILMYLGLLVSFFVSLKNKVFIGKKNFLDWSVIAFSLAVFFSVFFSADKILSIYGFLAFLAYPISYFVFSRNITKDNLPFVLNTLIYSSLIVCMIGAVQFMIPMHFMVAHSVFFKSVFGWYAGPSILHGGEMVSILGNANVLGAYLVLVLPVFACIFFDEPSLKWAAFFILNVFILIFTQSKSALIGFFVGFLLIIFSIRKKTLIFWSFLMSALLLTVLNLNTVIRAIFGSSFQSRLSIWSASLNLIAQHPIAGWGINTFQKISPAVKMENFTEYLSHAHNMFLNLGVETGVIGVLFFCLFLAAFFVVSLKLYKKIFLNPERNLKDWILLGIIAANFGFLSQNLMDYFFARGQIGILFFSFAGIVRSFADD